MWEGFKLGKLDSASFSIGKPIYIPGLLTIGLTPIDIVSSGIIMHPLLYSAKYGYQDEITGTVTYNGHSSSANVVLDTGTPASTILEDANSSADVTVLPAATNIKLTTAQNFTYNYSTGDSFNLTLVANPNYSKDTRDIFSIDFFLRNEYLMDYTDGQLGLKKN